MLWIVLTSLVSLWFAVRAKPNVGDAHVQEMLLDLDTKQLVPLPDYERDSAGVLEMPRVHRAGHIANIYYKKHQCTCILRNPIDNPRCTVVIWCRRNVKGKRWEPVLEVRYPVETQPKHDELRWRTEESVALNVMLTADKNPAVSTEHTLIWRLDLSGGQKVRLLFDVRPESPVQCIPFAYEPKKDDYYVVVKAMPDEKILGHVGKGIYNPTGDEVALYFHKRLFSPTWDRTFKFSCLTPSPDAGRHRFCIYAPNRPSERAPDLAPPATPKWDFTPSIALPMDEHVPSSDSALKPLPWEAGWGFAREEPQYLEVEHKKLVPLDVPTHKEKMSGLLLLPKLLENKFNSMIYYDSDRFSCTVWKPHDGTAEYSRSIWCYPAGDKSSEAKIVDVIYSATASAPPPDALPRPIAPHRPPHVQPPQVREQRSMTLLVMHFDGSTAPTAHKTRWRFDAKYGSILILQYDSKTRKLVPVRIDVPMNGPYLLLKAMSDDRVKAIHDKTGKYEPQDNEVMIYFRITGAYGSNFVCEAQPSDENIKGWICVYAPLSPMRLPSFDLRNAKHVTIKDIPEK